MGATEQPSVTVVVPVGDSAATFGACLGSLLAADPAPAQIIVVADGEGDGSWRLALDLGRVTVLKCGSRNGPAAARNHGARQARGDVLFFIDADVTVRPDVISRVRKAFSGGHAPAAVIGSYDDSPEAPDFPSQYRNLLHHYVHQVSHEAASTFWGACGAVRRDVFLGIGGFDENYPVPCIEDIELGHRLRAAGHRISLVKSLQVTHLKQWTWLNLLSTDFFRRALPWTRLILREGRMDNDLNLSLAARASGVAAVGFAGSLAASVLWSQMLLPAVSFALVLLVLNAGFYRFLSRARGPWFALRAIPFHWLYFLYSSAAFGIGVLQHLFSRQLMPAEGP